MWVCAHPEGLQLWTHFDVMDNLLCQVKGTKRVRLWPPLEVIYPVSTPQAVIMPLQQSCCPTRCSTHGGLLVLQCGLAALSDLIETFSEERSPEMSCIRVDKSPVDVPLAATPNVSVCVGYASRNRSST